MLYSKTTGGFYSHDIHGESIPADAAEITDEEHVALLEGQSQGKRIVSDETGRPILADHPAPTLAESIAALIRQIDADADAIYAVALGNRATEYAEAETQAQAFVTAGYTGAVPAYVDSWATATGNTAKWAADNILATSTAWRTAQTSIRACRLACKEAAKRAADAAALNAVKVQWSAFVKGGLLMSFSLVPSADGSDEETKKADVLQEMRDRKTKYLADISAIKAGTL